MFYAVRIFSSSQTFYYTFNDIGLNIPRYIDMVYQNKKVFTFHFIWSDISFLVHIISLLWIMATISVCVGFLQFCPHALRFHRESWHTRKQEVVCHNDISSSRFTRIGSLGRASIFSTWYTSNQHDTCSTFANGCIRHICLPLLECRAMN